MSNSSLPGCPQFYLDAALWVSLFSNYILTPIYLLSSTFVHSICLKAFKEEYKKENGFLYQIYLSMSRLLFGITNSLYIMSMYWFPNSSSTLWLHSFYWVTWVLAKVPLTLANTLYWVSLLFTLLIGADQFYAMWKPMAYHQAKTTSGKHHVIIPIVVVMISTLDNAPLLFRYTVTTKDNSTYQLEPNNEFLYSSIGNVLETIRSVVDLAGLIGLYVCNTAVILMFRYRRIRAKATFSMSNEMKSRQETEKILSTLAISQSTCTTVSITYKAVCRITITQNPTYYQCQARVSTPLFNGLLMIMDLVDIACVFAINKRFRRQIRNAVQCGLCNGTAVVTSVKTIR